MLLNTFLLVGDDDVACARVELQGEAVVAPGDSSGGAKLDSPGDGWSVELDLKMKMENN